MSRIWRNIAFTLVAAGVALSGATAHATGQQNSGTANKKFSGRYICKTTAEDEFDSTVIVIVPNGNKAGTFSYGTLNLLSDDTDFTENCGGLECPCNYSLDLADSQYIVGKDGEAEANLVWLANESNDETCGPSWNTNWIFAVTKNKAVTKLADTNVDGDFDNGPGQCNKEPAIR